MHPLQPPPALPAGLPLSCLQASDHEGHDYVMYTSGGWGAGESYHAGAARTEHHWQLWNQLQTLLCPHPPPADAGGCCDCGDTSSWRPQGCCPRHRPAGEAQGAAEPPPLPAADEAVARGVVGCALACLQLALEGSLAAAEPEPGQPSRAQHKASALRLMRWLVQLGQAPSLRAVICEEALQPAAASAAEQAAKLGATEGLPPEAAAVARMLQQQRRDLLQALQAVLPVPEGEGAEGAGDGGGAPFRPLPLLGPAPHQHSLLYWQMASLLPLDAQLVEVRGGQAVLVLADAAALSESACVAMGCRRTPTAAPPTHPSCPPSAGAGHPAHPPPLLHALEGGLWPRAAALLPPHRR